jgi:hypothetical protein
LEQEALNILNKFIKRCKECGEDFLAIGTSSGSSDNEYYPEISKYEFKCCKCPKYAKICLNKHEEFIKKNKSPIEIKELKCPENLVHEDGFIYDDWFTIVPCYCYFTELTESDWNYYSSRFRMVNLLEFFKD